MTKFKPKMVIGLVGERLAGKGQVAQYLAKKYRFKVLTFSDPISKILDVLHLPKSRVNLANMIGGIRERFGGDILAESLIEDIRTNKYKRVVVDGLRHPAELDRLQKLPNFILIYITASLKIRYQRALKRGEKTGESKQGFNEFKSESRLPTEIYIGRLGKKAKVKLVNEGSLSNLFGELDTRLKKHIK